MNASYNFSLSNTSLYVIHFLLNIREIRYDISFLQISKNTSQISESQSSISNQSGSLTKRSTMATNRALYILSIFLMLYIAKVQARRGWSNLCIGSGCTSNQIAMTVIIIVVIIFGVFFWCIATWFECKKTKSNDREQSIRSDHSCQENEWYRFYLQNCTCISIFQLFI